MNLIKTMGKIMQRQIDLKNPARGTCLKEVPIDVKDFVQAR